MKPWEFTGEEKTVFGVTLKRIRATAEFTVTSEIVIEVGENGGWIEKEENLSGNAWVSGNALVLGNAQVSGNAWVSGNAQVYGRAQVSGNAWVFGNAQVYDHAWVSDNAWVSGNARVYDNSQVIDNVHVCGNARVGGNARVSGYRVWVCEDALVYDNAHYLQIGPAGSRNDYTTFTRDKKGVIYVSCGCFYGSITEFRKKVRETHGNNKHSRVYLAAADLAELQIDTTPIEDKFEPPKEGENA